MLDVARVLVNDDLLRAKKLLMLTTALNSALFAVMAVIGWIDGLYALFVASFLCCLTNVVLFANSYQRWRTQ